jgi:hypothetical protein
LQSEELGVAVLYDVLVGKGLQCGGVIKKTINPVKVRGWGGKLAGYSFVQRAEALLRVSHNSRSS